MHRFEPVKIQRHRQRRHTWFVTWQLPSARWWWNGVIGVGVGLGMGLTVFGQPDVIQADLPVTAAVRTGLVPIQLEVPSLERQWRLASTDQISQPWWVATPTLRYWYGSAQLGEFGPVVIVGTRASDQLPDLAEWPIGTQLHILGSHQGWQTYQILETQIIGEPKLPGWLQTLGPNLVVLAPADHPGEWVAVRAGLSN